MKVKKNHPWKKRNKLLIEQNLVKKSKKTIKEGEKKQIMFFPIINQNWNIASR